MLLREQLTHSGAWLFRRRSYLPLSLILLVPLLAGTCEHFSGNLRLEHFWELLCLGVAAMGIMVRAFTAATIPARTSGRISARLRASELNTLGMYSIVRNPLYLGNFIMGLGISLLFHSWLTTIVFVLVFWLYHERIIYAEEQFLLEQFGQAFVDWAQETPAFIPNPRLWRAPHMPFSFKAALKREYPTLMSFIGSFTLVNIALDSMARGRAAFDPLWMAFLGVGALAYFSLRALHKKTDFLRTEGR